MKTEWYWQRMNMCISGTNLGIQKQLLTFIVNRFFTKIPKQLNTEKDNFVKRCLVCSITKSIKSLSCAIEEKSLESFQC